MEAFGIDDPKRVDKQLHRAPCKNVNFGIVYGLTGEGLYDLMLLTYATAGRDIPDWLTLPWCEKFLLRWFEIYPEVEAYLALEHRRADIYKFVWTEYGRIRRTPEVDSIHKHIRSAGYRQAGNAPTQGTCADVVKVAIRVIEDYFTDYHVMQLRVPEKDRAYQIMSIHDESILESPEGKADLHLKPQVQLMTGVTEQWMSTILPADGKAMLRWEKD
jgi:DNA polymerase-1